MNTKSIPIIVTLSAAGISCIISIFEGVDFPTFLVRLLLTVLFFYIIGIIVGIILYNAFPPPVKETDEETQLEADPDKENFETDDAGESAVDESEDKDADQEMAEESEPQPELDEEFSEEVQSDQEAFADEQVDGSGDRNEALQTDDDETMPVDEEKPNEDLAGNDE